MLSSYQSSIEILKDQGIDISIFHCSYADKVKIKINESEVILSIAEAGILSQWIVGVGQQIYNNIPD
jgi:hypothetical protein